MYDIAAIRIAVGILALLAITLLPVRQDTGRRYALLGFLAGLVVLFGIVQFVVRAGDLVVDNEDDQIIRHDIDRVRDAEAGGHVLKNMLLVDGSSETKLGLDPDLIRDRLKAQGYDVLVLVLAEGGANILERYTMMQRFSREMQLAGLRYGENTRLMMELHPGYESKPVRFFEDNDASIRSYYYPSIGNLLTAAHIYHELGVTPDLDDASVFAEMYTHSLVWDLKIGYAPLLRRFDSLYGISPFHPNRHSINPRHFTHADPGWLPRHSRAADLIVPQRLTFERADRTSALFGETLKGIGYFLITSLDKPQLKYGYRFCLKLRGAACIDGAAPEIRAALNESRFYFNNDHLSGLGAELYSRYFADQLVAQGVVVK